MNLNFITPSYTVNGTSYGSTLASIPGYSYSRPSSLQVMNSGGAVSTFNANVVPINALGLHSYIGLSNVCGDPQAFDAWQIAGATITPNTTVAPDGSTTADTVNVTASCFVLHSANVNNNQPYTFSWFAKRGTATDFSYRVRDWFAATDTVPVTSYYSQTNSSTFSRIIVPFTSTGTANAYVENNAATGTFFLWQAQIIPGNFPDGGPLVTSNTDTPSLSFTMPNGVYSVTYTFDDNTTQTISQTVSGNVFTVATAPTLNRGRIKSIVA